MSVPPVGYPVTIHDWLPASYGGRSERTLRLAHGDTARVHVEIDPALCDLRKSNPASLRVKIGWWQRSISVGGLACRDHGAVIYLGPFV